MKKRTIMFFTMLLVLTQTSFGQNVKFKKGKVLVDGKEILTVEKQFFGPETTFYSLESEDEVLYLKLEDGGTVHYHDDDYMILFFSGEDVKLESSRLVRTAKKIIQILIKEKVLNGNGEIDSEKLKKFTKKYDENITNRTVRY